MTSGGLRITILAGGVGGAKMAEGFAASHSAGELSIVGNVADDHEFHGLWVSPDIDTLTYTLADAIDRNQGWGIAGDSFHALEALARFGRETWMRLGDQDLATHIHRTELRRRGIRPSKIARNIAAKLGVETPILLPTDDTIATKVLTESGWLDFQAYFVREACQPEVLEVRIEGIEHAHPTPESLRAIQSADIIVIAPSNPIVSIDPILSVPGLRDALRTSKAYRIAVSPLIGGKALKGPADHMLAAIGHGASVNGIARFYDGLIDALAIDHCDRDSTEELRSRGLDVLVEDIVMKSRDDKIRLANAIQRFTSQRERGKG